MVRRKLGWIIGVVLFLLIGGYVWQRTHVQQVFERSVSSSTASVTDVRSAMGAFMRMYGSGATYEKMKSLLTNSPSTAQHRVAHIFGELLYKKDGLQGIVICDASFGFGCYHSFFGSAIAKTGEDRVSELDAVCVKQYGVMGLGCPHGIGHGLGEYFGPDKIQEQLRVCETLTWKGRYFGCQSGVFMEYNTPVITQGEEVGTTILPFEENRPYGICLEVDARFQPACFLELGSWWEQVLEKSYDRMGYLCNLLEGETNKESCFLGIGFSVAQSSNYDTQAVISACTSVGNEQSMLLCRAGASWSFFANPQYRSIAKDLCAVDSEIERTLCEKKADLLAY